MQTLGKKQKSNPTSDSAVDQKAKRERENVHQKRKGGTKKRREVQRGDHYASGV